MAEAALLAVSTAASAVMFGQVPNVWASVQISEVEVAAGQGGPRCPDASVNLCDG